VKQVLGVGYLKIRIYNKELNTLSRIGLNLYKINVIDR
jgi:hypothetical protein